MPYTIEGYIPDQVYYVKHIGSISTSEMRALVTTVVEITQSCKSDSVHFINDVRALDRALGGSEVLSVIRDFRAPSRAGWFVSVGRTNAMISFGTIIARQFLGLKLAHYSTFYEAFNFLRSKDPTICWEKADTSLITVEYSSSDNDNQQGKITDEHTRSTSAN